MKLSIDLGRWTATKAALAVAGALVVAGAIGSAVAMSPIVQPPIKWQGGWEAVADATYNGGDGTLAYVVPAGKSLIVTDLLAANTNTTSGSLLRVFSANGNCSSMIKDRVRYLAVGAYSSESLSFQTGIGFGPGQAVCLVTGGAMSVTLRGFLFTAAAAPAS